jgi:uncharacterized protein (DUF4415 family)
MNVNRSASRKRSKSTEDAPELTDKWFRRADLYEGDKLVRRGRPKGSGTKELVSLRVDKDALAAFRASGPGWQVRINDAIVRSAKRLPLK